MPFIRGLPERASFARKKALTAAAANYGTPMLWAEGLSADPPLTRTSEDEWSAPEGGWQGILTFTAEDLAARYADLAPQGQVDLVVIGCPQASLEEIRITASAVRSYAEMGSKIPDQRLWVFTSGENFELAVADGSIDVLEQAGAVILKDTCPEVTPYNRTKYNHLLTNSQVFLQENVQRLPQRLNLNTQAIKQFKLDQRPLLVKDFSAKRHFLSVGKPW
jgi:predicted aconitase